MWTIWRQALPRTNPSFSGQSIPSAACLRSRRSSRGLDSAMWRWARCSRRLSSAYIHQVNKRPVLSNLHSQTKPQKKWYPSKQMITPKLTSIQSPQRKFAKQKSWRASVKLLTCKVVEKKSMRASDTLVWKHHPIAQTLCYKLIQVIHRAKLPYNRPQVAL